MPKLSIIMGVFNSENTIKKCVESIINQSYKDWEFIICDDGSSDHTLKTLEELSIRENRIRILKNQKNLGLAATLNKCILESKGQYLVRQDADDFSALNRLEELILEINRNPDATVIGTSAFLVDNEKIWGRWDPSFLAKKEDWIKGTQVIHPSVIMKKKDILEVGNYNPNAIRVEDFDLWLKLLKKNKKIISIKKPLYYYQLGKNDYKRRKWKYRLNEVFCSLKALKSLSLPFWYLPIAFKPILAGLIPNFLIFRYHQKKFGT
jgi:glycosyltransferase EpsE